MLNREVSGLRAMQQYLIGFDPSGQESQELTNYLTLFANINFIIQRVNQIG